VLYNGKDMQSPIPSDRYNAPAFSDALGKKGAIKTQKGYFLTNDLSCLDASFFSMTKTDLQKTDPQQRQILEVTRECLETPVRWTGEKSQLDAMWACLVKIGSIPCPRRIKHPEPLLPVVI
jgi:hypothetical protein